MAFTLAMTLVELSDNSLVRITDTTPDYGVGAIQDVFDNGVATITPVIRGIAYDAINVTSQFDGGLQSSLVFDIKPTDLLISSVAQFSASDAMPDGDYEITYNVQNTADNETLVESWLVYGVVEQGILDTLRVTDINTFSFEENLRVAMIRLAHYAYMQAMIQSAYVSEVENLRDILTTLETMIANGIY
jgi:hypothetical protein